MLTHFQDRIKGWKPCQKTQISLLAPYSSYSTTVLHPSVDVVLDILSTPPLAERWEDSALQHDLGLPLKCSPRPLLSPPSPGKLGKCFKNSSQVSRPAHPPRRWLLHFWPNGQESSPGYLGSGDQLEVDLCQHGGLLEFDNLLWLPWPQPTTCEGSPAVGDRLLWLSGLLQRMHLLLLYPWNRVGKSWTYFLQRVFQSNSIQFK